MSCLFNSLSHFIPENSFVLRQKICDYLLENKPIIEGLDTAFVLSMEHPNYIQQMRSTNTWGGGIEIQCACNLWELRVLVRNDRDHGRIIEFIPLSGKVSKTIRLYWTGGHYEPIRESHLEI
jgi:hypothetical protein